MRATRATYAGRCGVCDDDIDEGDLIVSLDDEWVHADCAEREGEPVERPAD